MPDPFSTDAEPLSISLSGNHEEKRDERNSGGAPDHEPVQARRDLVDKALPRWRPVYKSTKMSDKREAQRLHDIWAGELRQGTFLPRADQTRYEDLVTDLKQHYRNTESRNLVEVDKRLKHLDGFFASARAMKIDPSVVGHYIEHRKKQQGANGTINRELGILTRMFRLALENGPVTRVPVIRKLKEAAPRHGFFERVQFEAVRKHLSADLQVAATIAYTFGWRTQSEVLSLERRQLDLEAGTLRLDPGTTKNDDGPLVYLTPELKSLLCAQVERVKGLERKLDESSGACSLICRSKAVTSPSVWSAPRRWTSGRRGSVPVRVQASLARYATIAAARRSGTWLTRASPSGSP